MLREDAGAAHDITAIARKAQVSPIRLVRSFRKAYGISFARYIRVLQMQRAFTLLADPFMSISAVAADAGFSDQSHMTRAFTQTYGVTPAALRSLLRRGAV
jgi:AraC-like DNA-binding protein